MKHVQILIVSLFLIAASACSIVTVMEPIGEEPVQIQPEQWEGLWKLYLYDEEESFWLIEVFDSENGVLKVQYIGRKPESFQVYLRESDGWMFGSYRDADDASVKGMYWGRFKKDRDRIVIWVPDHDRFKDLVDEGLLPRLPDEWDPYILTLSGLQPEHLKLITSESNGELFQWEYPSFMVRVSDDID